jgi:predicted DNA-binding transcriptional regulator YafY
MFSKDIQQMKSIYDAPIKYDRLHKGYAYTQPGFSIKEFPLTYEEIDALDISTALLQQLKKTRLFYHFENAINKVIVGYRIAESIGKSEKQLIQVEEPVGSESIVWLEEILKGIIEKMVLIINYQGFGKPEKDYAISPYLLKEYRNRWYLAGLCHQNKKVIILALDRIKSLNYSKLLFISDNTFVPDDFFKYSFGITQLHEAQPQKVLLSFTPYQANYIESQPLHHSQQIIKRNEDEVLVQLLVYLTPELKMAILSFGTSVKVLAPEILQQEIKNIIQEMYLLYQ